MSPLHGQPRRSDRLACFVVLPDTVAAQLTDRELCTSATIKDLTKSVGTNAGKSMGTSAKKNVGTFLGDQTSITPKLTMLTIVCLEIKYYCHHAVARNAYKTPPRSHP
jgi:hypothetical protein